MSIGGANAVTCISQALAAGRCMVQVSLVLAAAFATSKSLHGNSCVALWCPC